MKYEYIEKFNPRAFKRRFGVRKKTFQSHASETYGANFVR